MGLTGKVQTSIEQIAAESGTAVSGESKINFTTDDGLAASVVTNPVTKEQTVNHTLSLHASRHNAGGSDLTQNYYDATYIVGDTTAGATHATLYEVVQLYNTVVTPVNMLIKLLPGTHHIAAGENISITDRGTILAIVGSGKGVTNIVMDAGVNANGIVESIAGAGGLILAHFSINGQKASQNDGSCINVQHTGSTDGFLIVDSVSAINGYYYGIAFDEFGSTRSKVSNCDCQTCGDRGFYFSNRSASYCADLVDCVSIGNTTSGFFLYGELVRMLNCMALANTTYGAENEGTTLGTAIFSGCTFVGNGSTGLSVGAESVVINGCTASSNSNGIYAYPANRITISGCLARSNTNYGIAVATGSKSSLRHASIIGNTSSANGLSGIYVYYADNMTITGNIVDGNNTTDNVNAHGIELLAIEYCTVTANRISGAKQIYGIKEYALGEVYSNNNTFTGNMIDGAVTGSYFITGINSRVLDPCDVSGTISRAAGASDGTTVVSSLGTGSCPRNIEIFASYDNDCTVFSHGTYSATFMQMTHYSMGATQAVRSNAVFQTVAKEGGGGHRGTVTAIGAANGSTQDTFTISWEKVGGGAATTICYRATR